jgi:N,N'-diacetylchitobiose transport system substrate-binding protein
MHPRQPRRRTRLVVGLAVLGLLTAACGSNSDDDNTSFSGNGNEKVDGSGETLTLWIMQGTNKKAESYFDDVTTAFKDETGADLDVKYVEWAVAHDKFTNAMAGGTTPDVAEVGTTWTPEFADAGALLDLTDQVDTAGLDKDLVPGLVEAGTYDGGLYGMPWYGGIRSVVYRTDVFEKAGVEPPTTWDEFIQVADKVKAAEPDMITFPVPGDSEYGVDPWIWGAGGEIATQNDDGTYTAAIDSPEAQEGISFYTDLATEHDYSTPAATTWDEADLSDAFTKGDAAMMIAGSWTPPALEEANPDLKGKIGAFPIPGEDGGLSPSFLGGSHLGIFNTTKDPDLAWALVRLMSTGKYAEEWGSQTGFFPGTKTLLDKIEAENDPTVAPFAKQAAEASKSVPVTPKYGQIQGQKTISAMLQSILSGKASVEDASKQAAEEMDKIFSSGS